MDQRAYRDAQDDPTVRGFFWHENDTLVIETNSTPRFERMIRCALDLAPDLELLEERRTSPAELLAEQAGDVQALGSRTAEVGPEFVREVEGAPDQLDGGGGDTEPSAKVNPSLSMSGADGEAITVVPLLASMNIW